MAVPDSTTKRHKATEPNTLKKTGSRRMKLAKKTISPEYVESDSEVLPNLSETAPAGKARKSHSQILAEIVASVASSSSVIRQAFSLVVHEPLLMMTM